jgi:hypothetical protein
MNRAFEAVKVESFQPDNLSQMEQHDFSRVGLVIASE